MLMRAFEVLVAGEMVAVSASLRPLYDPKSERIKANAKWKKAQ